MIEGNKIYEFLEVLLVKLMPKYAEILRKGEDLKLKWDIFGILIDLTALKKDKFSQEFYQNVKEYDLVNILLGKISVNFRIYHSGCE